MKKTLIILLLTLTFSHASEPVLTINSGYSFPETNLLESIIKEGFKRAKVPLKYQTLPNQRSLLNANNGINDGEAARIWELNTIYPNLVRVPVPIHEIELIVLTKRDLYIHKPEDLKSYHVGVIRGMKIAEKISKKANPLSLTKATRYDTLLKMLDSNRLDVVITGKISLLTTLEHIEKKGFLMGSEPILSRPLYMHLHKKHIQLIPKFEKAFQSMLDDGTIKAKHDNFFSNLYLDKNTSQEMEGISND